MSQPSYTVTAISSSGTWAHYVLANGVVMFSTLFCQKLLDSYVFLSKKWPWLTVALWTLSASYISGEACAFVSVADSVLLP